MRIRRLAAAVAVAIAVVAAAAHGRTRAAQPAPLDTTFASRALKGRVAVDVYLPATYATDGRRYPVVYFLHGLPASASAYRGASFVADALEGRAILVAPQGARDGDSDPEYHDWGVGRNWETALAAELPVWIDAHFRTIRGRHGRAVVGLSAGGYGAFLLGLHHLDAFGAIESWSGYFHPTDPGGTQPLDVGSTTANTRASAHAFLPSVAAALRSDPTLIAFYVGSGDARFAAENRELDRELTANRVPHVFRVYPGGHSQVLWQSHARDWLALALNRLAPPRPAA